MEPKDEIRARINIDELIGEYIELRPAGHMNFKALCPFHGEKTPSFYVSREKEIWHCFGCHKGGDIFSFVMDIEGVDFPEALRILGKKAGVEIPEFKPRKDQGERDVYMNMHKIAGQVYRKILKDHERAEKARKYLLDRGITDELVDKFQLGFSLDSWETLSQYFKKNGYDEKLLISSGLSKKRKSGSGVIDRFRNRIMIPLNDATGNIVGFTARLLDGEGPKYLNSSETLIYNKRKVLYGLHLAKLAIRKEKSIIVVEGNLDVIASHKAGVENVVASSGTALTEDQLALIKKLTNKIIFSFDSDTAGFNAAKRGIRLAQKMEFEISVISISSKDGKDPDDIVQKDPKKWRELVKNPVHIMKYYFDHALKDYNPSSVDGKREFSAFIINEISHIKNQIEQEHWLQKLSDIVHVELNVLRNIIKTDTAPLANKARIKSKPEVPQKLSRIEKTLSFIIGVLLNEHEHFNHINEVILDEYLIKNSRSMIYKDLKLIYTQVKSVDPTQINIFERLSEKYESQKQDEALGIIREAFLKAKELISELSPQQVREELDRHVKILADKWQGEQCKQLEALIREAERSGNKQELNELLTKYNQLISK